MDEVRVNGWMRVRLVSGLSLLLGACGGEGIELEGASFRTPESVSDVTQAVSAFSSTYLDCNWTLQNAQSIYVSTNGSDSNSGDTSGAPLATLNAALAKVQSTGTNTLAKDYRIFVRGGTYRNQRVDWNKVDPNHRIQVEAFPGETPIFDGRAVGATTTVNPHFFNIDVDEAARQGHTNITLKGLTIQYYGQIGILLRGECNRIYDNTVRNIGTKYAQCKEVPLEPGSSAYGLVFDRSDCTFWKNPLVDPITACKCEGYGSIDFQYASKNLVQHNDVIDSINAILTGGITGNRYTSKPKLLHAFYVAYESQLNLIEDNYVRNVSGTPFKFRDGSNDNKVYNNYLDRAGSGWTDAGDPTNGDYMGDTGTTPSVGTELKENVLTFSTHGFSNDFVNKPASFEFIDDQNSPKYFQGDPTTEEVVTATTVADVNGDTKPELFVALYYPLLGFSKLVYTDGMSGELRTVAYSTSDFKITALAGADFMGTLKDQVVMAIYNEASSHSQILVGSLEDGVYRFNDAKLLHWGDFTVSAMTANKFNPNGFPQLVTAAVVAGVQKVYLGDGKTEIQSHSSPGVDNGTPLYSSSSWRVTALSSGALTGSAVQLVSAFKWIGSGTPKNRIYIGDGQTTIGTSIWDTTNWLIKALAVGKFGGSNPRLATAFDVDGVGKVYVSSDFAATVDATLLYSNQFWDITSLSKAQISTAFSGDELITAFDSSVKTEVWWGDGKTATSGATNGSWFYRNPDPTL